MLSEEKRIKTKAQLKEYLDVELEPYRLHGRQYISYIFQISERAILRRHILLLRKTEYHLNAGHKLIGELYYARLMKLQLKYSIHIPINCFGKGLQVMHVGPCTMNGEITVGENCCVNMYASVVWSEGKHEGVPTLGDNVTLGLGSIVQGNVTIADNITVGSGALVNKSFLEPGIIVAGVPATKIGEKHTEI